VTNHVCSTVDIAVHIDVVLMFASDMRPSVDIVETGSDSYRNYARCFDNIFHPTASLIQHTNRVVSWKWDKSGSNSAAELNCVHL